MRRVTASISVIAMLAVASVNTSGVFVRATAFAMRLRPIVVVHTNTRSVFEKSRSRVPRCQPVLFTHAASLARAEHNPADVRTLIRWHEA